MPAPRRSRPTKPAARPAPPLIPLGTVIREFEAWRTTQTGKPSRGALRDYWQKQDAQHAQRPDYALWRELHGGESPPQRRQDVAELSLRALKSPDSPILWAALTLLPEVLDLPALSPTKKDTLRQALRQRLEKDRLVPISRSPLASALVLFLARSLLAREKASFWQELQSLLQTATPGWKPGRKVDLNFWDLELPWPAKQAQMARRLATVIHRQILDQLPSAQPLEAADLAPWHFTAWTLHRDARPASSPARGVELETLLAAASTARLGGDADQAARLTALVLHLLPPQAPESFLQRCRVAAWHLSEVGLCGHPALQVPFEDLPFPGDPPASEMGQAAARQYLDTEDPAHGHLTHEVQTDPLWDTLRRAGIVLHHPLAALSWVARKAQAYGLKKQHELLQAAATLAARHHRLLTLGRLLPHLPPSPQTLLDYAQKLRQNQRRMPFLRDEELSQDCLRSLRHAWAKLEPEALQDPEHLFFLHETLHDRTVTTLRALPADLRLLALRHLHSRHQPSTLVQALVADPRHMQQLEHQRQVELWSIATELRERPEWASTVWLSLVLRGEPNQGRYSLIIQGPSGRVIHHDRLRPQPSGELDVAPLIGTFLHSLDQVSPEATQVLAAVDPVLAHHPWAALLKAGGRDIAVTLIPSWEWAFRVSRETSSQITPQAEWRWPVAQPPTAPLAPLPVLPNTVFLLPTADPCDADTRWAAAPKTDEGQDSPPMRSLQLGQYEQIVAGMPVTQGSLKQDLIRLSLAHSTRSFLSPAKVLNEAERKLFIQTPLIQATEFLSHGLPLTPPAMPK